MPDSQKSVCWNLLACAVILSCSIRSVYDHAYDYEGSAVVDDEPEEKPEGHEFLSTAMGGGRRRGKRKC